jgi:hypothetical protein
LLEGCGVTHRRDGVQGCVSACRLDVATPDSAEIDSGFFRSPGAGTEGQAIKFYIRAIVADAAGERDRAQANGWNNALT